MSILGSIRHAAIAGAVAVTLVLPSVGVAQDATPIPYSPGTDPASLSGSVSADGSSTVFPIMEALAEEFGAIAGGVQVTVDVSGTGGGFVEPPTNPVG